MPTVIEDLERGHQIGFDQTTISVQRIFRVSGLTAAPELQIMEALGQPEIPVYVDPYPLPADPSPSPDPWAEYRNIAVIARGGRPDGPQAVLVTVTYTNDFGPSPAIPSGATESIDIKQVRFATAQKTTTVDRNGAKMLLDPPPQYASLYPQFQSEAQVNAALGVIAFERTESSAPTSSMRDLVGKINQFALGPYGAETLLFSALDASSNDNQEWIVSYEFQFDETGWQHSDRYRDPTGRPPSDAVDQTFDVLKVANFSSLNLDFSD